MIEPAAKSWMARFSLVKARVRKEMAPQEELHCEPDVGRENPDPLLWSAIASYAQPRETLADRAQPAREHRLVGEKDQDKGDDAGRHGDLALRLEHHARQDHEEHDEECVDQRRTVAPYEGRDLSFHARSSLWRSVRSLRTVSRTGPAASPVAL